MPDHATRRLYQAGCRCVRCRAANATYAAAAAQAPTGRVDATPARLHLRQLQTAGLGYRQAATMAGVAPSTAYAVRSGRVTTLHPRTAARLLAARPALAHGAVIPGTKTWRFLDSLRRDGFTRAQIAARLGNHAQQLQLHARVRVRSALKVAQLSRQIAA